MDIKDEMTRIRFERLKWRLYLDRFSRYLLRFDCQDWSESSETQEGKGGFGKVIWGQIDTGGDNVEVERRHHAELPIVPAIAFDMHSEFCG